MLYQAVVPPCRPFGWRELALSPRARDKFLLTIAWLLDTPSLGSIDSRKRLLFLHRGAGRVREHAPGVSCKRLAATLEQRQRYDWIHKRYGICGGRQSPRYWGRYSLVWVDRSFEEAHNTPPLQPAGGLVCSHERSTIVYDMITVHDSRRFKPPPRY